MVELSQIEQGRREICFRLAQQSFPPRYRRCTIEGWNTKWDLDGATIIRRNEQIKQIADSYSPQSDAQNSLFFTGRAGMGKTHLAAGICFRLAKEGVRSVFLSWLDFLDNLRSGYHEAKSEALERLWRDRHVLLLDDLCVVNETPWQAEQLQRIVERRYSHELPTIITTNLTVEEIGEKFSPRVESRIHEAYRICEFNGAADRRKLKNAEGKK